MKNLLYILIGLTFASCMKDEIPRPKPTASSANIVSVSMGNDYGNQLFYSLKDKKVVLQNNREIWDLGFESSADGFHLIVNGSKMMAAFKTNATELSAVTSDVGAAWRWDVASGNLDSTAFGDWRNNSQVYIVDRGTVLAGAPLQKIKLKILSVDENKYEIEWAPLSSSASNFATILKDDACSFTYFSFTSAQTLTIEPPKETWDICFTTYTHYFLVENMPYLVAGVISNRSGVRVFPISSKAFADISYVDYLSANFNDHINNIGYNWKVYDFDLGLYTVDMNQNFIVETADGRAYKLHFLDFYDDLGTKGAPKMELQEMVP